MPLLSIAAPRARAAPFVVLAVAGLAAGIAGGLERMGVDLPGEHVDLVVLHGPLLVVGFLSTVIGLERAAALGRAWALLAPAGSLAGIALLLADVPAEPAKAVLVASASVLVGVLALLSRRAPSFPTRLLVAAALGLVVGNALWLSDRPVAEIVPWWTAFLVLTIVAERLELAALGRPDRVGRAVLPVALAALVGGVVLSHVEAAAGARLTGAALLAIAVWLLRYDIARRTVRIPGLPRFVAVALVAGYAWLAVGGVLALLHGDASGPDRDAVLHAVLLGFVFSMIFAHAPIVFPALLDVAVPYRPAFYAHVALLHAGLVVRLAGDVAGEPRVVRVGGVVGAAAIALFLAATATSAVLAGVARRRRAVRAAA